ncbi:hypothetical protein DK45_4160 [Bordetella bronchiseptica]|nr:hypothetical protein DK45_4160 [Bordetella bronchiseptica]
MRIGVVVQCGLAVGVFHVVLEGWRRRCAAPGLLRMAHSRHKI